MGLRNFFLRVKESRIALKHSKNAVGYAGELIAILILKVKLQKILYHRYKTYVGEIDIISLRGKSLFFTEVKTSISRRCYADIPLSSKQRASILRTAKLFVFRNPRFRDHEISFQICRISLHTGIIWIKNAWQDSRW
ncbi:YraN family protein [Anaplasma bovis]|uniref:YraN family protein n=1 Tax=Anaplasma bovis TaxID=186733 RepID=UPI002FEFB467